MMSLSRLIVDRSRHYRPCFSIQRRFYENVYPRVTHFEIDDEPMETIRKFSPCGQYLVTFTRNFGVNLVVAYKCRMAHRKVKELSGGFWKHYFGEHFSCQISAVNKSLQKDFCLFVLESKFLVVASVAPCESQDEEITTASADENDYVSNIRNLENTTFHVISMRTGKLCSQQTFEKDHISLAHNLANNAGVSVRGNMIAILSLYRQEIHLFRIRESGQLQHLQTIGSQCFPDDDMYLSRTYVETTDRNVDVPAPTSLSEIMDIIVPATEAQRVPAVPWNHNLIVGLKQRLLSFLWKQAWNAENRMCEVRSFFHRFDEYKSLCMWKLQIFDDHHLLLKYGSKDYIVSRTGDPLGIPAYFVVYNFISTQIVNVYENNSEGFLKAYENNTEYFFEDKGPHLPFSLPLPSNSFYARESFQKQLSAARTARHAGHDTSIRRSLSELPVAPQNIRESPYFDPALFDYDEKLISHSERLKHCTEFPVKFYSRKHGNVVFRIPTGKKTAVRQGHSQKKLASFLFHPFLPFVITIQHVIYSNGVTSSHTNFHVFS
eukprot:m.195639 g.195639  ORF g.195639 m.195639 type:complete len:547 (+) comp18681_c0_seq6:306-1946(+)